MSWRNQPSSTANARDVLEDYDKKMRDAEADDHEGKRKVESVWSAKVSSPCRLSQLTRRPIMRLTHARSRYIYDLYYKRELISRELYDWLLKQKYADAEWVRRCLWED